MASYQFDQAEGLRRILVGARPRVVTFLSADAGRGKGELMTNLGASLARTGSTVLLLDACAPSRGIAGRIAAPPAATLLQAACGEYSLKDTVREQPQGFGFAMLTRGSPDGLIRHAAPLGDTFAALVAQNDIVMVDAELDDADTLPLAGMEQGEIVIQVSTDAASIKSAYALIKRLNARLGRRPFSVLVTGASEQLAHTVFRNLEQTATRYLAVQLHSLGSVPADEHLTRATRLGRSVVDAFPLAGASVALRLIAGRFATADAQLGA